MYRVDGIFDLEKNNQSEIIQISCGQMCNVSLFQVIQFFKNIINITEMDKIKEAK